MQFSRHNQKITLIFLHLNVQKPSSQYFLGIRHCAKKYVHLENQNRVFFDFFQLKIGAEISFQSC